MYFSKYVVGLAKAVPASDEARVKESTSSSSPRTMRIPFPPPPSAAFIKRGYPICCAWCSNSSFDVIGPEPGIVGTPWARASRRAATLSPIKLIASGLGPMKVRPLSSTACAKAAFSARKP